MAVKQVGGLVLTPVFEWGHLGVPVPRPLYSNVMMG